VLAAINTVVSVAYYVRVLAPAYFDASAEPLPLLGKWAAVGTAMSAAALVGFGITAEPLMRAFAGARLLP
jgi:NADH-quinone oxidoreductase subunit N